MKPIHSILFTATLALSSQILLTSCGSEDDDPPPLAGVVQASAGPAAAAYQKALAADQAGNAKKAAKLYGKMATDYSTAKDAPQARFREAQLHEQLGNRIDAFDAYSDFLNRYQGSKLYSQALERQTAIAKTAANGEIKTGMFGSSLETSELVAMQEKVRDAAPQAASAPRAQYQIGEIYQNAGKARESIEAYRRVVRDWPESKEAPEAQYRVGMILVEEAKRGNQDKGNLDRARDAFRDYLTLYPNGSRASAVRTQISTLGNQDVERSFEIAEFYRRKGDNESAKYYYREVMKKHSSGSLHDKAKDRLQSLP
jgi:TolA-binding protein